MGVVFRAEDPKLKRQIALKAMLPSAARSEVDVIRFLREARAQAAVEHDHVAAIHQVGEDRGVPFIAMPLLKGQPLSSALRANPQVPIPEAVRIAREMAEGLAAAHESGLIHRDIKPGNVWLEGKRRRVKILDFGLARPNANSPLNGEEVTPMTQAGVVVGTPAYMSPEQAKGDPLDARSDLFSLGIVLYQMLAGREPFRAGNITGLLIAVATEHPPRPALLNTLVPPVLDAFTMRLLGKNPNERPATAEDAASQLRLIEAGLGVAAFVAIPVEAVPAMGAPFPSAAPDPWDAIDATEMDISGSQFDAGNIPSSRVVLEDPDAPPPRKRPWIMIGAILAFLAVTAVAADIIIKIKNKDGTETEIKAPDGSTVTVTKNGKEVAKVGPNPVRSADPDRDAAKWVLALGGLVKVNDGPLLRAVADLPGVPFKLTHAELRENKHLTDAGLAIFKDCKHLTSIWLSDTQVTDAGLAHLKDCKTLECLVLGGCHEVTDAGLANFKDCNNLRDLWLNETQVTDGGLANFKDCKKLVHLELIGTQVTDGGLLNFKDCNNLRNLWLNRTQISDEGVTHLAKLKSLNTLNLDKTQVSATGAAGLAKALPLCKIEWSFAEQKPFNDRAGAEWAIKLGGRVSINDQQKEIALVGDLPKGPFQLTALHLSEVKKLTDNDLKPFQGCVNLKILWLGHTAVGNAGLANFKGCDKLVYLVLDGTNVTDAGLANFEGHKSLTQLFLNSTKVGDEGMAHLKDCANLQQLWIDSTKVTNAGILLLKDCKNLTTLNVRANGITESGVAALYVFLPKCKIGMTDGVYEPKVIDNRKVAEYVFSLKGKIWINNQWDPKTKIASVADLPMGPFNLTGIDLWSTQAKDADMTAFKDCKNLAILGLTNTQVGDVGLAKFKDHKKLVRLHLSYSLVTDDGLAYFKDCAQLSDLLIIGTKVTDAGLAHFKESKYLSTIWLRDTKVTDDGLANFKDRKYLIWLDLTNTKVSDAGVAHLKECSSLTRLQLEGTQVTDASLATLKDLKKLTELNLRKTKVTAEKVNEFAEAFPQCRIEWEGGVLGPKAK